MSKHFFVFVILVLFLLFLSISAQSIDPRYLSCPSFICSDVTIRYPFWSITNEVTTQTCGYPGFGINCFSRYIPAIILGNDSYYVRNINYESKSMALVDYDVSPAIYFLDCPRVRHNIDLGSLPLNFSTNSVNLSFHYNCSGGCPFFATPIPCLGSGSCVNVIDYSGTAYFEWDSLSCDPEVVTTVLPDPKFNVLQDMNITLPGFLQSSLSRGFELNWASTDDCNKCEESDGRCGHHNTTGFMCFCPDGSTAKRYCKAPPSLPTLSVPPPSLPGPKQNLRIKLVLGLGSGLLSVVLLLIIYCVMKSSPSNCVAPFVHKTEDHQSVEDFINQYGSLTMKRYNYHDIKKMTKSFQVKLGQGGFGTVYKGKLSDGHVVAIKVLNTTKASGKEFINEVASIGRTSHVNIVTLLGFCFDYKKRALVYEFMPNGSLEKFILSHVPITTGEHIGVHKLYEIALGIARGLDYLHRGCNTRILHLDIKPHNILLDEDFCPKIADFGLAKLYSKKESIVSMLEARGTIGYIAPGVFNRNFGGVSHKSDVYSYGMLILEMVGGRKNVDAGVGSGRTSEIYFPYWICNRLEKDEFLLDSITTLEENDYARKMTIVGLWCIQAYPNQRPLIQDVIEMLEGRTKALEVPPKPLLSSSS